MHIVLSADSPAFSVMMGPTEIPAQSAETIKIPTANYEFGANFIDPKVIIVCYVFLLMKGLVWLIKGHCFFLQLMLFGRVMTDGRLNARLKCDLSDNLTLKGNAQVGIFVNPSIMF